MLQKWTTIRTVDIQVVVDLQVQSNSCNLMFQLF